MGINLFEILVFPGFTFIFTLIILFEQICSRVYARFYYAHQRTPMFIPIIEHFKLYIKGEKTKFNLKSLIQSFLLFILLAIPLIGSLFLPINSYDTLPRPGGGFNGTAPKLEGVVGVLSFEGDILFLIGLFFLFTIFVFIIQYLQEEKTTREALSSTIKFLVLDVSLFFALAGPVLAEKSLSLSLLSEDIRMIIYFNPVFGFLLLLPLSTIGAIFALSLKFDQPYFDQLNTNPEIGLRSPVPLNWKLSIWNLSMRAMEFLVIGLIATVCLGGAYYPIPYKANFPTLAFTLNFIFKCVIIVIVSVIIRSLRPRMILTQTINFTFKILIPICLVSLLMIGGYIGIWGIN
ncbi:MAG: NADH-quinone oxidoreductase subunit H [Candidatus Heimdallarchaeota archaeon]|nr:NADH-quinone oxidoreductase subunit H [Candidatus Heimdallarchaeota archaeon]